MLQLDARGTASDLEVLASKDFEQMTADELRLARVAIAGRSATSHEAGHAPVYAHGQRRGEAAGSAAYAAPGGWRGPEGMLPLYKERQRRAPPLVVMCDISGSMDSYARVFLHFLYALINGGERVHAFLFGTRLTNVTRILRDRDPDTAMAKASGAVQDWAGGTRIGESLHNFQ